MDTHSSAMPLIISHAASWRKSKRHRSSGNVYLSKYDSTEFSVLDDDDDEEHTSGAPDVVYLDPFARRKKEGTLRHKLESILGPRKNTIKPSDHPPPDSCTVKVSIGLCIHVGLGDRLFMVKMSWDRER